MAKRFKLKLSRVVPSFQSCRSKDPSSIPTNPVPSFSRPSPANPTTINLHLPAPGTPEPCRPHYSMIKRHVSTALTSIGCGFRSRSTAANCISETDHTRSPPPPPTPDFHWEKEDRWHVIAKIYDETAPRQKVYNSYAVTHFTNDAVSLPPDHTSNAKEKKKRRSRRKKKTPRIRISTSSADSGGLFSSEGFDEEDEDINNVRETETLMSSSKSLSTDSSSEFNPFSGISNRKAKVKKGRRSRRARKSFEWVPPSPARLSRFQWLIPCTVEGKVRESLAVVKKSEDPYEDFRRSMMEMILEKQMFEEKDLEQLLHCFLSLNSRDHHGVILRAFSEIWEAVFCRGWVPCRVSLRSLN